MQSIITLSSTESEYVALSTAMREVLPMMQLLQEFQQRKITDTFRKAKVHCTLFEDNAGAIEISTVPKMRPRTKHINQHYHFFRQYVEDKTVSIKTKEEKEVEEAAIRAGARAAGRVIGRVGGRRWGPYVGLFGEGFVCR